MPGFFKFLIAGFAVVLLGVLGVYVGWIPGSAVSAEARIASLLANDQNIASADWAQFEVDGRNVVLHGEAPDAESLSSLTDAIRDANGAGLWSRAVAVIDTSDVTIYDGPPVADPFIWRAEHNGDDLSISGYAPSQSAQEAIFQLAAMRFPDAEISGALELASGAPDEEIWLSAASVSLQALARLETGVAESSGASFLVRGEAADETRREGVRLLMSSLSDGGHRSDRSGNYPGSGRSAS